MCRQFSFAFSTIPSMHCTHDGGSGDVCALPLLFVPFFLIQQHEHKLFFFQRFLFVRLLVWRFEVSLAVIHRSNPLPPILFLDLIFVAVSAHIVIRSVTHFMGQRHISHIQPVYVSSRLSFLLYGLLPPLRRFYFEFFIRHPNRHSAFGSIVCVLVVRSYVCVFANVSDRIAFCLILSNEIANL